MSVWYKVGSSPQYIFNSSPSIFQFESIVGLEIVLQTLEGMKQIQVKEMNSEFACVLSISCYWIRVAEVSRSHLEIDPELRRKIKCRDNDLRVELSRSF